MEDMKKLNTQKLYAAWGTTREEHLAKMKKFFEKKEAEGRKFIEEYERKAAEEAATVVLAVPAEKRAAARRPAAAAAKERASKGKKILKLAITKDELTDLEKRIAELLIGRQSRGKRRAGRVDRHKIAAELHTKGLEHLELKRLELDAPVTLESLGDMILLPEARLVGKRRAKGKYMRGAKAAGKGGIKARAAKGRRGRR